MSDAIRVPDSVPARTPRFSGTKKTTVAFGLAAAMLVAGPAQLAAAANQNSRDAGTRYSKHTQSLITEFNAKARDVRIVMMDRDWFQTQVALRQIQPEDKAGRAKLASEYIKERTGVDVPPAQLLKYGIANDLTYGEGYAMPAGVGPTEGLNPGVCVVFGQLADVDAPSQTKYLTGLNSGLHPQLEGRKLKNTPDVDTFRKHVDYHEVGHCLYHSQMDPASGPSSLREAVVDRNRSEMYAEIMAALMLAHYDGVDDFAEQAARMRLTGGALNGPASAHYGDPMGFQYYSPAMYTIHGGARGAQKEIDRLGVKKIQKMSMDELRALGHKILDENDLDTKKVNAVMMMFTDQFDLTRVEKLAARDASYKEAYEYVKQMKADMNAAIPNVVDVSHLDKKKPITDQIQIDFAALDARMAAMEEAGPPPVSTLPEATRDMLKDRLIRAAGGDKATTDKLVQEFIKQKDFLRKQLEKGNEAQREASMLHLAVIGSALRLAVAEVQGKAAPGVKTAPEAPSVKKSVYERAEYLGPGFAPAI